MRVTYFFAILGIVAAQPALATETMTPKPARQAAMLFHSGGLYREARGDALVGAEAALRDGLLPSPVGDAATYDDAPGCTIVPAGGPLFGHRFMRLCR